MAGSNEKVPSSLWFYQFKALVKRNYLIKRRFWNATIWEFIIPTAFLLIFAGVNFSVSAQPKPITKFPADQVENAQSLRYISGQELIITPNDATAVKLSEEICRKLKCTPKLFLDTAGAEAYYAINKVPLMGVILNTNNTSVTSYSIRYPKEVNVPYYTISTRLDDCSYPNQCPAASFLTSGIVVLQATIDSAVINMSNPGFVGPTIEAQLMPELRYIDTRNSTLRIMFPLYFVYAMSFLVMYICYGIVDDKFKNRKDHLIMMGVRPSVYWLSWAVVNLPQAAFVSVAGIIVMAGFSFFSTAGALVFFFFAVVVYCFINILIGICWSCIIQKTDFVFFTLFGTVGVGAIALLTVYTTDYTTDFSNPTSPYAPLSGILCLLPPTCMVTILERMYSLRTTFPGGLVREAFTAGDLPLVAMFVILVFDLFLWMLIALWLEGITPNALGSRLSCWFCLDKKYWRPDPVNPAVVRAYEQSRQIDEHAQVEATPRSLKGKEAVRLFNMRKEFVQQTGCRTSEVVKAVNGVDLDIYEGQITALLGHNGAGKTTLINMMTGIMPVTSGSATLYGYDVVNGVDLQSIREMMGICLQKDVIIDRVTVREHLELYARIKGVPEEELNARIISTVEDCDLTEQIDMPADKLSGGQKRKLNVGMALIGDPKILFLDEPTAGMDPYSRRHLWNLLKKSRAGRVILLTTHFMDEADILADRKAVIAKGRLQCAGSSLYLKNKFGIGYQLTLLVEDPDRQDELTFMICEIIDDAAHKRTYGKEITYNLPIHNSAKFPALFMALDDRGRDLQINNYAIAMTTLEEVFLKLGEEAEEEERLEKEKQKTDKTAKPDAADSNTVSVQMNSVPDEQLTTPINMRRDPNVNTRRLRLWYMVKLRMKMAVREVYVIVFTIFFAIFTAVGVVLMAQPNPAFSTPSDPELVTFSLPASLVDPSGDKAYDTSTIIFNNRTGANTDLLLTAIRSVLPAPFMLSPYDGTYSSGNMPAASAMGYDFNDYDATTSTLENVTIRYNHSYLMSLPLAVNKLSSSLLRLGTNITHPEILTTMAQWPSSSSVVAFSANAFAGLSFVFAIYMGSSIFTVAIVNEKEKKMRPLLRTGGVSVATYFGAYMIVIYILLGPILVAAVIGLAAAQVPALEPPGAMILFVIHLIIQVCVAILLSFCWSYAFERAQSAGNIVSINIWGSIFLFLPVNILILFPNLQTTAKIVHHVLCFLVPYYAFPGGILMFTETYKSYITEVQDLKAIPPSIVYFYPENGVLSAIFGGLLWVFLLFIFLRVGEIKQNGGKMSDLFKCFSNSLSTYNSSAKNPDQTAEEDEDVTAERAKVDELIMQGSSKSKDVVMIGSNLRKEFPKKDKKEKMKVAVKNVAFHVDEGQVFGLLGPNGAGKTTVLNMVIAELAPTAGQVIVDNIEVHSALSDAFNVIGFCPQFDALWETATPIELLIFFGLSAGYTEQQAAAAADYYISMLKIQEHKDKYSKNLSGGTRRKVSFAVALMGWPRLVLLDEPSTGLDPASKRFLWDTIRSSFEGHERAAILTTHYMEEADALCSRIGIMVNGGLECVGTSQHLKSKYGDGYQLEVKVKDSVDDGSEGLTGQHMEKLKKFVSETFPRCTVIEEFSDRIQYTMPASSISSPAQVFQPLERNKEELQIEEYSFSQATLEQVFIQFAKQQLEADEDEENAVKSRQKSRSVFRLRSVGAMSNETERTPL